MQNNLTILQWYEAVEYQNHYKSYAYGDKYNMIVEENRVPSFQLILPLSVSRQITSFSLVSVIDGATTIITTSIKNAGLEVRHKTDYDIVFYPDNKTCFTQNLIGQYYAVMTDGTTTWYSEIFTLIPLASAGNYLQMIWLNSDDIEYPNGMINYDGTYVNNLLVDCELGKPEYLFEEEIVKRDGYQFIEKQISDKLFRFEFAAPEYLCDALRLLKMHDNITIVNKGIVYTPITLNIDFKWTDFGNLALVSVEFTCDTVVKKIGTGTIKTSSFSDGFSDGFEN